MRMGLLDPIRGAKKAIIPSLLGIETMKLMGMVYRYELSTYVIIMPTPEMPEGEGDNVEGSQPVP